MRRKIEIVKTQSAPAAIGPYSQGVIANGFLFVSGQLPIDPNSGEFVQGDIKNRTAAVLKNIQEIATSVGCSLNDVVKTTIFMTDIRDFVKVNEVYASFFNVQLPARAVVQVAALPKNADIEMECVILVS